MSRLACRLGVKIAQQKKKHGASLTHGGLDAAKPAGLHASHLSNENNFTSRADPRPSAAGWQRNPPRRCLMRSGPPPNARSAAARPGLRRAARAVRRPEPVPDSPPARQPGRQSGRNSERSFGQRPGRVGAAPGSGRHDRRPGPRPRDCSARCRPCSGCGSAPGRACGLSVGYWWCSALCGLAARVGGLRRIPPLALSQMERDARVPGTVPRLAEGKGWQPHRAAVQHPPLRAGRHHRPDGRRVLPY